MPKFESNYKKKFLKNRIFLLGYMGCGKSTIGIELAKQLKISFIDLDSYLEKKHNASISSIFQDKGEFYFRKAEKEALNDLLEDKAPAIIGLGGGTPCYYDNMDRIVASGHTSIYCSASISTLASRLIKEKEQRPMISHIPDLAAMQEFIGKHLFERAFFYRKASQIIQVDEKSVQEIICEIVGQL